MLKRLYYQKKETKVTEVKGYFEVEMDYIQLYKNFIEISHKINSATTFKILHWLLAERMGEDNGIAVSKMFADFNTYLKAKCGEECVIVESTFYRSLDELVRVGAINKMAKGLYYANPNLFWASDTKNRIDLLKLHEADENQNVKFINPKGIVEEPTEPYGENSENV